MTEEIYKQQILEQFIHDSTLPIICIIVIIGFLVYYGFKYRKK